MKFVDISGFGHSGKSIITDLLKECRGYQVPHYNFEFNLLRIQGGLIDLKAALSDNWSPIRSDAAIRRFRKLVRRIGPAASFRNPASLFLSNGMNYDHYFGNQFSFISEKYIQSLINYEYETEWPYPMIDEPSWKQFYYRVLAGLKLKNNTEINVTFAAPVDFRQATNAYLDELFNVIKAEGMETFVTHNATEPFCPTQSLDLFSHAKVIIVQRDPRDIYASTFVKDGAYNPSFENSDNWRMKQSFLSTHNIKQFVERQKLYYDKVEFGKDDNRVLRLRYEDVILNYDENIKLIFDFLGESSLIQIHKRKYFDPAVSVKNVGLWKKLPDQTSVNYIRERIQEFCYNV